MRIGTIGSLPTMGGITPTKPTAPSTADSGVNEAQAPSFAQTMKDAVGTVNDKQANADAMAQALATGDVQDVHKAMLALNQASNAFGLTVQVRNKALESYQEIMRMQV